MEDIYLWKDEEDAEAEASPCDSEFGPYDDCLTNILQAIINKLMIDDEHDNDFEEF